jgi:response regulator NasT
VLQASRGLSEPEAFRWIQKTSMNRRMTMRALAQEIIDGQQPTQPAGPAQPAGPEEPGRTAEPKA